MTTRPQNNPPPAAEPDLAESPLRGEGVAGLVSIIISTYNRADLLGETLASVAAQSYPQWEAVVVDDGSTDDTAARIADIAEADKSGRIRYFCQDNAGAQVARNRGMRESRGEYILFLDSDDLLHADKLRLQIGCLRKNEALDFCVGRILDFTDSKDLPAAPAAEVVERIEGLNGFRGGGFFLIHAPLFRRAALSKAGAWDAEVVYGHETNFFGRALACGLRGVTSPDAIAYRREHGGRYSLALAAEKILAGQVQNYLGIRASAEAHGTVVPAQLYWTLYNDRANLHILRGETNAAREDLVAAVPYVKLVRGASGLKLTLRRIVLACFRAGGYRMLARIFGRQAQ